MAGKTIVGTEKHERALRWMKNEVQSIKNRMGYTFPEAPGGTYEPALGNPVADGYLLQSTAAGVRSWQTLNQAAVAGLTTADSPAFVTVKCSGLTNDYIPYHVSDAAGLANSPIYTDGTNVGIGTASLGAKLDVYSPITADEYKMVARFGAHGNYGGGTRIEIYAHTSNYFETNSGYSATGFRAGSSYADLNIVNGITGGTFGAINFYTDNTLRTKITPGGSVLIGATAAVGTEKLRVDGTSYHDDDILLASGKVVKVNSVQVLGTRVVDARFANTPNSGDATTDGIIAALQALVISHGLGAAA
ncbi:MAG: hypothetical protein PHC52_11905 [Syntrophales bacterium]|nr:hypothetical protein [Syntrophales bacterium]